MDAMEEKLQSILGNPQMMQQIMSMAQAMGQSQEPPTEEKKPDPPPPAAMSNLPDAAMLQKMFGIAKQSGIDKNQQALLKALGPYLTNERIRKLEKAMRSAKIASLASTVLSSNGLPFFSGR